MGELPRAPFARARRAFAALATVSLLIGSATAGSASATADTAPPSGTPATVSADPLPTVQQNGVVYAQVTVGNIVYATGSFSETWPAGQTDQPATSEQPGNETPRANLLAYDITTGELTSFNHTLNAQGLAIAASPDGKTLYVGGDFTTVDGVAHDHIAAFDIGTGALLPNFTSGVSNTVSALVATSSTVYVGGNFFYANGVARTRLAAFTSAGALLSWAPTADNGQVSAMTITPDGSRIIVGGRFTTLDGQAANGMGSLDTAYGDVQPWAINTVVKDALSTGKTAGQCGIDTLSTDGTLIYGGGFSYHCGNFEGTFAADPSTGKIVWINDCHGDTYSTQPIGEVLYVASHAHDCSAIGSFPDKSAPSLNQRATAFTTYATGTNTGPDAYTWNYSGQPDGSLLDWFPTLAPGTVTHLDQAAWSVTGNASYVAYGGEFPTVNGVAQQGLVRFAVRSLAPNEVGPIATTSATTLTPTVRSSSYGEVDLSWTATWDRDNANLTYTILRYAGTTATGTPTTVGSVTQASTFWQLPVVGYQDSGLTPGSTYVYRIRVTDPLGNSIGSATSQPVTVSSSGTAPSNTPPVAAFTSSCSLLTCTFDGSGSTDADGSVSSYAWDFGDGTSGTGATPEHSYAKSGTHTVTLTVGDTNSATSAPVSHQVTVTVPPPTVWAKDTFAHAVRSGWGKADTGGSWSRSGCAAQSVSDRRGVLTLARGKACSTWLPGVQREATDTTAGVWVPSVPKGGTEVDVLGRRVSSSDDIRLQLHFRSGREIVASLVSRVAGKSKTISKSVTIRPSSKASGRVDIELEISGVTPTHVAAKVWPSGSAKPSRWTVVGSTSTSALQHRGSVGFAAALPTKNNPKKATVRVTDLLSRDVAAG